MLNQLLKIATCAAVLVVGGVACAADTITLRFVSPLPQNLSYGVGADWWMDEIGKRTGGRVEFVRFHGGSLVAGGEVDAAVQLGRADIALTSPVFNPGDFPLWLITTLPFVSENSVAQMRALNALYETNATFKAEFDKLGMVMTLFMPVAVAATGTKEPISSVIDLAGKKLRAVGLTAKALAAIDVEPIAIIPAEVYESIDRGVIDGFASLGFDGIPGLSLQEVAPYVTNIRTGTFSTVGVAFNADSWAKLPDDVKATIREVSKEYMQAHAGKLLSDAETNSCDAILAAGGSVTILPQAEVSAWKEKVYDEIIEGWRKTAIEAVGDKDKVGEVEKTFLDVLADQTESISDYRNGMAVCAERQN